MSPKAVTRVEQQSRGALTEKAVQVLRSREEAEAYVASVCFKHGPPRLIGVELEWLLAHRGEPPSPLDPVVLSTALGPHAPLSLDPMSPALPLSSGSTVTVEPGGQVELASQPSADLGTLFRTVESDVAELHRRLADHSLQPVYSAGDPFREPRRMLTTPRYVAMEAAFDRLGTDGRSMMCSTAAVQPCFDLGERAELELRWAALHALGPVLVAAFANSPVLHGRRTGWKSSRWRVWMSLDPPRTRPPDFGAGDPVAAYARRAMEASLICLRGERNWLAPPGVSFADWLAGALPTPPTTDDLDLHLTTLFPPVRPHGHAEVRYVDAQVGDHWVVPVAVLAAVLSSPGTTSRALDVALPVAGHWRRAARDGLADAELAAAARTVFELASGALRGMVAPGRVRELVDQAAERVSRGRCPADEPAGAVGPADDRVEPEPRGGTS